MDFMKRFKHQPEHDERVHEGIPELNALKAYWYSEWQKEHEVAEEQRRAVLEIQQETLEAQKQLRAEREALAVDREAIKQQIRIEVQSEIDDIIEARVEAVRTSSRKRLEERRGELEEEYGTKLRAAEQIVLRLVQALFTEGKWKSLKALMGDNILDLFTLNENLKVFGMSIEGRNVPGSTEVTVTQVSEDKYVVRQFSQFRLMRGEGHITPGVHVPSVPSVPTTIPVDQLQPAGDNLWRR